MSGVRAQRTVPTGPEIARQWDRIAGLRDQELQRGNDGSLRHVLVPEVLSLGRDCDWSTVIDVGCGSGYLTALLAERARSVIGVDISQANIEIARRRYAGTANVSFSASSIEQLAATTRRRFSLVIGNLFLMATPHLEKSVEAVARLLRVGGHGIFTITHPCFWQFHWDYWGQSGFCYTADSAVSVPFPHEGAAPLRTTHFHHSLSTYLGVLMNHGLVLECLSEPMPSARQLKRLRRIWRLPRFLALRVRKTRNGAA